MDQQSSDSDGGCATIGQCWRDSTHSTRLCRFVQVKTCKDMLMLWNDAQDQWLQLGRASGHCILAAIDLANTEVGALRASDLDRLAEKAHTLLKMLPQLMADG